MPIGTLYKKFIKEQGILSDKIARFAGDMRFVYWHAFIFALWIVYNVIKDNAFDPYPFILLTLVVSLEAIFLSTFVLINQNKDAQRSERRAQRDLSVDTKAEEGIQEIKSQLQEIKSLLERNKK